MMRLLTTTAALALLATTPSWAQTGAPAVPPTTGGTATIANAQEVSQQDRDFANQAAIGGKLEVDLGKTAESKAKDQSVKDFGKRMVDDHSKANDKLATVAKDLKLTLPTALDQKHKDTEDRLTKLSGDQFDHEYITEMVKDHQEDAALFQKQISSGSNGQLKTFASDTLPMIQQHLKLAQDIQTKLGPAVPLTSSAPGTSPSGSGSSGGSPSPSGGIR